MTVDKYVDRAVKELSETFKYDTCFKIAQENFMAPAHISLDIDKVYVMADFTKPVITDMVDYEKHTAKVLNTFYNIDHYYRC